MSKQSVFEDVSNIGQQTVPGFEVETALQINPQMRLASVGVHFMADDFEAPVFITVDELRRMADEAEAAGQQALEQHR